MLWNENSERKMPLDLPLFTYAYFMELSQLHHRTPITFYKKSHEFEKWFPALFYRLFFTSYIASEEKILKKLFLNS